MVQSATRCALLPFWPSCAMNTSRARQRWHVLAYGRSTTLYGADKLMRHVIIFIDRCARFVRVRPARRSIKQTKTRRRALASAVP